MLRPHLIFTKHTNSFSVRIPNLEKLSVEQIQQLEHFVDARKGIFDFNSYSFIIRKRMEFYEFDALLKHLDITATCKEHIIIKETQPRIGFGQYKGMQFNELPDSYMLWLKTNYRGFERELVEAELANRTL